MSARPAPYYRQQYYILLPAALPGCGSVPMPAPADRCLVKLPPPRRLMSCLKLKLLPYFFLPILTMSSLLRCLIIFTFRFYFMFFNYQLFFISKIFKTFDLAIHVIIIALVYPPTRHTRTFLRRSFLLLLPIRFDSRQSFKLLLAFNCHYGADYLLKPLSINKKRLHFKQAVKTTKNADCQKQSAFKSLIKFYFSISNTHKALRVLESKMSPSSTISLTRVKNRTYVLSGNCRRKPVIVRRNGKG